MVKIQELELPEYYKKPKVTIVKKNKIVSNSTEKRDLRARKKEISIEIRKLREERSNITRQLNRYKYKTADGSINTIKLYALELEDSCWYIGMSYSPEKRFIQHSTGKRGANWTKLHKPIRIVETRETYSSLQEDVAPLEDDMTLEYAMKYGSIVVRGGGFCQTKPRWPDIIKDNEYIKH